MKAVIALESGLAGALALTAVHETVKRINPNAPRMDFLGMNALAKVLHSFGRKQPSERNLFVWTLAGDLAANAIYYSLSASNKNKYTWIRGLILGMTAGLGAVMLPGPLGLNKEYSRHTLQTKILTVGLYVAGGVVTAAVSSILNNRSKKRKRI